MWSHWPSHDLYSKWHQLIQGVGLLEWSLDWDRLFVGQHSLACARGVNGRSMMRQRGGVLSKVGSHFDNNTRKRNKISTVHNSTLWASKPFSDLRFSISCPMTPQSLSEVYAIVELSWWKFPLSFLISTSYPQQSQYTYKNVCIVPGGHAGMTHVAAVVGDVYCRYQVPEYTTYSEVSHDLYAEVTNNISTYPFF